MSAPLRHRRRSTWRARCFLAITLLAGTLVAGGVAQAQDSLSARVDRLQRELNDLQRAFYRGEGGSAAQSGQPAPLTGGGVMAPTVAAQLDLRMAELEDKLRSLTGQLEEVSFEVRQIGERLDRLVADVDYRLRALEGEPLAAAGEGPPSEGGVGPAAEAGTSVSAGETAALGAGPSSIGTLKQSDLEAHLAQQGAAESSEGATTGNEAVGELSVALAATPSEQYDQALTLLRQREYDSAREVLNAFLAANPDHERAGHAMYWLGETYYVEQDYRSAAVSFAEGVQNYPQSPKAPDSLLKLGMSLGRMGSTDEACAALAELTSRFGQAQANILQKAESERQRLGCG